jgi:hypothetical protein
MVLSAISSITAGDLVVPATFSDDICTFDHSCSLFCMLTIRMSCVVRMVVAKEITQNDFLMNCS